MVSAAAALAIAVAVYGRGCNASDDTAKAAAVRFLAASRAGTPGIMYEMMSKQTRKDLQDAARKATELVGGSRRFEAVDMISIAAAPRETPPPTLVETERGSGRVVFTVQGAQNDPSTRLVLVLEDGRWRVDVPDFHLAVDKP